MSTADSRSDRIRRREKEEDAAQQTARSVEAEPDNQPAGATTAAGSSSADPSALAAQPPPPSLSVQPLPEQFSQRKRPRRSARLACHLDKLAVVELQLVMQFLDSKSKLNAARCSRRLLQVASAPFAWSAAATVGVEIQSSADVESICTSLLRFAPIHLHCDGLESLQSAAAVPHLVGLDTLQAPHVSADDLPQLLQHPNLARLQTLRLDAETSKLLMVDTMRLVARLPLLRTFDMGVPAGSAVGTLLQVLATAPALTDLAVRWSVLTIAGAPLINAVGGFAGLRSLCLSFLIVPRGLFLSLCSAPGMRQLQHFELVHYCTAAEWFSNVTELPNADEYRAAFSALVQLQSLTLETVFGIDALLEHLHHAPALRLLSIRCVSSRYGIGSALSPLPRRTLLLSLLADAPKLEVRLLMATSLDRWLQLSEEDDDSWAVSEEQWLELQEMGAEMERVSVVDWEPPDA